MKSIWIFIFFYSFKLIAADVTVIARDKTKNKLLSNAVVWAIPVDDSLKKKVSSEVKKVIQQDLEFVPHVLAVQKGTTVTFPNKDSIKHSLYSLAEGNKFSIPLYDEKEPRYNFESLGPVALGCNIHDWMVGYIYVVDTPYFGTTTDGRVKLTGLPEGEYNIHSWHPDSRRNKVETQKLKVEAGENLINFSLNIKKKRRKKRPAYDPRRRY